MFDFFKKSKEPASLGKVSRKCDDLEKKLAKLLKEMEELKKTSAFSIQKIGIVRYNPFSGVGSNQSFSAALLDSNNNGIVISSLYTREGNRVYGKPIKNSKSEYFLSEEEKTAIKKATGSV